MHTSRKRWPLLVAAIVTMFVVLFIWLFTVVRIANAATPTYSVIGTHPDAVLQPTTTGKTIIDLAVEGTQLYSGYGDYGTNTGPIKIRPFNLSTNTFGASQLTLDTDQIGVYRKIGGFLYAPMIDPHTAPWTMNVGYGSNSSGSWQSYANAPAIHLFDVATLNGTDRWMVGSATAPDGTTRYGATAYRSVNGTSGWTRVQTDQTTPYASNTGFERYYWAAAINGKMYIQANGVTPTAPLRIFDGVSWTTGTTSTICNTTNPNQVEVFNSYIICPGAQSSLIAFNGTTIQAIDGKVGEVFDLYKADDGYLYLLGQYGISRTNNGTTWSFVASAPNNARSLAIYNNTIYVGTTDATIAKLDTAIDTVAISSPTITALSTNNSPTTVPTTTTVTGQEFMQGVRFTFGGTQATIISLAPDGTSAQVIVPAGLQAGAVDVRVENVDGGSATLVNGFTFTGPLVPVVDSAVFSKDEQGRTILTVSGQRFSDGTSMAWAYGTSYHLITLDGQDLNYCVEGTNLTSTELTGFGLDSQYFTEQAPCYYLFSFDMNAGTATNVMTSTSVQILLPDNFDTSKQGTVQMRAVLEGQIVQSSAYVYNNVSVPDSSDPMVLTPPNTGIVSKISFLPILITIGSALCVLSIIIVIRALRVSRSL